MPIRVIPVIDLRAGKAVHARGGDRAAYQPVRSTLYDGDDPLGLALAFRDRLGLPDVYVADLDAIGGRAPDLKLIQALRGHGVHVLIDPGLEDARQVGPLLDAGARFLVAATESLAGPEQLGEIVREAPADSVVFGLDLNRGRPVTRPGSGWRSERAEDLIDAALAAGVGRLLILDSARVGSGRGVGTDLLAESALKRDPRRKVMVGGGVANAAELAGLNALGFDSVLVGSALHDGRIGRLDVHP